MVLPLQANGKNWRGLCRRPAPSPRQHDDLQLYPNQPVPNLSAAISAPLSRWLARVFVNPNDGELARREREAGHREHWIWRTDRPHANLGFDVSRGTFFRAEVTVQLAQQAITILFGPIGQVR